MDDGFDRIKAGLMEALADARGEGEPLDVYTVGVARTTKSATATMSDSAARAVSAVPRKPKASNVGKVAAAN